MIRASTRQVAVGVVVIILVVAALAVGAPAQAPSQTPQGSPSPTSTQSTQEPTPTPSGTPTSTVEAPGATSITDTEYVSVKIDANGSPLEVLVKEWWRVRREGGGKVQVTDPGLLREITGLGNGAPDVRNGRLSMEVDVDEIGHKDIYFAGTPKRNGQGAFITAEGPQALPVSVKIRYYTGEAGSDEATTQVNARDFRKHHGPFKLVITVTNNTKRTEEVSYNDVQTKQTVTGIAEVFTPFSVQIPNIEFPDDEFDGIRTNGVLSRRGSTSQVQWNLFLAPPDYPGEQHAIIEGRANAPAIPKIDVVAQPVYPEAVAEALTSAETQFQKGRRSFYFDVFNLLRENLIALGGLFSVLDDSFSNLALPLIGPEKGNRDAGSFGDANLLWGVWTVAKGTEQLGRAVNALDYAVQLARDGVKGQISTMQLLRAFIGKSDDKGVFANQEPCPIIGCGVPDPAAVEGAVDDILAESLWANLKDLEYTLGGFESANDPLPYLPEAPAAVTSASPSAAVILTVIKIKLAILEHNFYCMQYENHSNECSTILGLTNKPGAEGWDKFSFVKFPFGQIEVEQGLRAIEEEGTEQIQAALGNKIQTNSFVWGTKVITEGVEGLIDSFHQLGATWRYVADSVQNFGIFGIETSRSILQLDINTIDIDTASKAAASRRAAEMNNFLGKPIPPTKGTGVQGQLVLTFSTDPEDFDARTAGQKTAAGLALLSLLSAALVFARFRLYWI